MWVCWWRCNALQVFENNSRFYSYGRIAAKLCIAYCLSTSHINRKFEDHGPNNPWIWRDHWGHVRRNLPPTAYLVPIACELCHFCRWYDYAQLLRDGIHGFHWHRDLSEVNRGHPRSIDLMNLGRAFFSFAALLGNFMRWFGLWWTFFAQLHQREVYAIICPKGIQGQWPIMTPKWMLNFDRKLNQTGVWKASECTMRSGRKAVVIKSRLCSRLKVT